VPLRRNRILKYRDAMTIAGVTFTRKFLAYLFQTIPAKSSWDAWAVLCKPLPPYSMLENIAFFLTKRAKITWLSTLKVGGGKNLLRVPTLLSGIVAIVQIWSCRAYWANRGYVYTVHILPMEFSTRKTFTISMKPRIRLDAYILYIIWHIYYLPAWRSV